MTPDVTLRAMCGVIDCCNRATQGSEFCYYHATCTKVDLNASAPAPDVTLWDVLVLVRAISSVMGRNLAGVIGDQEASGRMSAISDDAAEMLRKEGV